MGDKGTTFCNDLLKLIFNAAAIANLADNAASSPLANLYLALHTAESLGEIGQPAGELVPGRAAVGGLEKAAAGSGEGGVLPRALTRLPEHGIDGFRVARVEGEVDGAGGLVLVEDFREGAAPVGGAEDAALRVRAVRMAQGGDEQAIG